MIPDVAPERLHEEMEQFDQTLRGTPEWADWERKDSYKFAIDWNNRRYPVKQIIAMATGIQKNEFSGGVEANGYLQRKGLNVVGLPGERSDRLRAGLEAILARYAAARTDQFGKQHPVWQIFQDVADTLTASTPVSSRPTLNVDWSAGQGNWARVPWISFLDSRETNTTQRGVYCVYLFRQDLSGVYLTFIQGVVEPKKKLGAAKGREFLLERARTLRTHCKRLIERGFELNDDIDLRAKSGIGADYEGSTVAYKFYASGSLPADDALISDLEAVLGAYDGYLNNSLPPSPAAVTDLNAVATSFATALRECGLVFGASHMDFVRLFLVSLATKRFVILTGLSGSGKTQVALRLGEWLGADHLMVVPVRPDWTGAEAMFGYEDALLPSVNGQRAWHAPAALRFMLKAAANPSEPHVLVLDEMNLAHVERYFADFLSGMETNQPCLPNLESDSDRCWRPRAAGPEQVRVPRNLFVVGTVNVDETTYMFSPKVLDRANTIEFRVSSDDLSAEARKPTTCQVGPRELIQGFLAIASDEQWHLSHPAAAVRQVSEELRAVHVLLAQAGFEFGHRVFYEAIRFAAMMAAAGDEDPAHALDAQILQKVLPRLHGSRRKLEGTLVSLANFCAPQPGTAQIGVPMVDPLVPRTAPARLPRSFEKLARMLRNIRANQFTSFTE
jgi:5-methylcytosine-specific restriction protein B